MYNSIQGGFGGKRPSITKFDTDLVQASRNFTITQNKIVVRDSHVWMPKRENFRISAPDPNNSVLSLQCSDNDSPIRVTNSDFNPNDSVISGRQTANVYPKSIDINKSMAARKNLKTSGFAQRRKEHQSLATETINEEITSVMKTITDRNCD